MDARIKEKRKEQQKKISITIPKLKALYIYI
jgi:hypothetical protein